MRALDRALALRPFPGFIESVPTHRSLLVCFDPARISNLDVQERVREASAHSAAPADTGRLHEIPVCYGGDFGPDLEDVARRAGCSGEELVRRHAGRDYRAFMLGFLPGFAYLGLLDEALDTPRLPTPRPRVPAGSVAVAGRLTGVYPSASPGGWRILGRTAARLFDVTREPPSLIAPGDHVRFVPVERLEDATPSPDRPAAGDADSAAARGPLAFEVLSPGLLTTVQAEPRRGYRRFGVAGAGPVDPWALTEANRALGNPAGAAGLECTLVGPTLRFLRPTRLAIAGADLGALLQRRDLGEWPVPRGAPILARAGNVLSFSGRREGFRACLAFEGGLDVPFVLGSASTDLVGGFGGRAGRALAAGDALRVGVRGRGNAVGARARPDGEAIAPPGGAVTGAESADHPPVVLRVVLGPQDDHFPPEALATLQEATYTLSAASDRIGCRLEGPALRHGRAPEGRAAAEIVSDGMVPGAIQVPPDGRPIVMMADGPTTGGYPKIATVVGRDLRLLAQLVPGAGRVRFVAVAPDPATDSPLRRCGPPPG